MPYVAQVAIGRRPHLNVFGRDYDTVDGTGTLLGIFTALSCSYKNKILIVLYPRCPWLHSCCWLGKRSSGCILGAGIKRIQNIQFGYWKRYISTWNGFRFPKSIWTTNTNNRLWTKSRWCRMDVGTVSLFEKSYLNIVTKYDSSHIIWNHTKVLSGESQKWTKLGCNIKYWWYVCRSVAISTSKSTWLCR